MPRFVILEHDHPSLHWDFILEVGEVLWTWRLSAPRPFCPCPCTMPGRDEEMTTNTTVAKIGLMSLTSGSVPLVPSGAAAAAILARYPVPAAVA